MQPHLDGVAWKASLYLPVGYIFAERIIGMNDFMGIRAAFVLKKDTDTMEAVNRLLLSAERPSALLTAALDAMAAA